MEDLPKGAFVCEYVGEVVTNTQLGERNRQQGNVRHTYPVHLDADWHSESILDDDLALCLDATNHGNAARFINHKKHPLKFCTIDFYTPANLFSATWSENIPLLQEVAKTMVTAHEMKAQWECTMKAIKDNVHSSC